MTDEQLLRKTFEWINSHARHDEEQSEHPCYGLKYPRTVGRPDRNEVWTCGCGLDELRKLLGDRLK